MLIINNSYFYLGGTIDITVHEVCFGGKLKELYKATGGAWGGTMVDNAFLDFIAKLIGTIITNVVNNYFKTNLWTSPFIASHYTTTALLIESS